jgi:hypothetical protein
MMSKTDDDLVRNTVASWTDVDVRFIGVESGYRERLRAMFGAKEIDIQ